MSVFLRGARVDLLAEDAADVGFAAGRRAWILPAAPRASPAEDGEIVLVWAAPRGATEGSVALDEIDWIARRARLVAHLAPGADPVLAREALELALRYAHEELGLETIEARVRADDAGARALLRTLGFTWAATLAGAWHDHVPVDVTLGTRYARVGPP